MYSIVEDERLDYIQRSGDQQIEQYIQEEGAEPVMGGASAQGTTLPS